MKKIITTVMALAIIIAIPLSTEARWGRGSSSSGSIQLIVTDQNGSPISGAKVRVVDNGKNIKTNSSGNAKLVNEKWELCFNSKS